MSQAEVFQKKLIKAREENDGFEKSKLVDQAEREAVTIEEHIHFEDRSVLAVIYKHGMRLVGCALVKQEEKRSGC